MPCCSFGAGGAVFRVLIVTQVETRAKRIASIVSVDIARDPATVPARWLRLEVE